MLSSTPALAEDTVRVLTDCSARGLVSRSSLPFRPGDAIRWRTYSYDGIDRQITVSHPRGESVVINYRTGEAFGIVETVDESGNQHISHVDAFGNSIYRDRFAGTDRLRTTFGYDALNRLISLKDGRGSRFWYAHDGHGNRVFESDPDLDCRETDFDKANRLSSQRSASGTLITYSYDALGRVSGKTVDETALQCSSCSYAIRTATKTKTGSNSNVVLDAGTERVSNVVLSGGAGSETYLIWSKSGQVMIPASAEAAGKVTDVVRFGDLKLEDFDIVKQLDPLQGDVLVFSWDRFGNKGSLKIAYLGERIERFEFADGGALAAIRVRDDGRLNLDGTTGNDRMAGSRYDDFHAAMDGNDIIDVGPGNGSWQHPRGGRGNDTYFIGSKSGKLLLHEGPDAGTDKVIFKDLDLADLSFAHYDYGNSSPYGKTLKITWNLAGKTGEVRLSNGGADLERIQFTDGSAVRAIRLRDDGRLELDGTSGHDLMSGSRYDDFHAGGDGNDVLDVGPGNGSWQHPRGGNGDDVYVIGSDSGNALVHEGTNVGTDTFRFKDLVPQDLEISFFDYGGSDPLGNALQLKWNRGGFSGTLRISNKASEFEWFEFANGNRVNPSVWRTDGRLVIHGTPGNDMLIGTALDDFIYGHDGNDILDVGAGNGSWQHPRGQGGDDTYLIAKNSGNVVVHEGSNAAADTIRFKDLVLADFSFRLTPSDASSSYGTLLEMSWSRDGHSGLLQVSREGTEIERFEFADGKVRTTAELRP